jgi:hypothetical protein
MHGLRINAGSMHTQQACCMAVLITKTRSGYWRLGTDMFAPHDTKHHKTSGSWRPQQQQLQQVTGFCSFTSLSSSCQALKAWRSTSTQDAHASHDRNFNMLKLAQGSAMQRANTNGYSTQEPANQPTMQNPPSNPICSCCTT